MAGADFVRADLHVHTYADTDPAPEPDLTAYIEAALRSDVRVLGVTDHNTARFAAAAVEAAKDSEVFVVPGIEVSSHDGHLLGLFPPDGINRLEEFALPQNLKLKDISATDKHSSRSMLDLAEQIHALGGLAIPAHIDAANGAFERLSGGQLEELLASRAVAGIEFARKDSLQTWFTEADPDAVRMNAWKKREGVPELRERGLARLMSSDAHSVDKVGLDRSTRTLTRLRLDDLNFEAVRNAIAFNPKARCKAEVVLPASYPWIQSAEFTGGFLDGVSMEFSPNLNCIIGGRGSGKSTALVAIRAALGADTAGDDPDAVGRMPDETTVRFIDGAGSERQAVRRRDTESIEPASGSEIRLRLADLGQDESGRLARGYEEDPLILLKFLDGFIIRYEFDEREGELIAALADNANDVKRTSGYADQIRELERDHSRLQASLDAARKGKVDLVAEWAALLAAQGPFLRHLEAQLAAATQVTTAKAAPDMDKLAADFGLDLARAPADKFVEGADGLRRQLEALEQQRTDIGSDATKALVAAAAPATAIVEKWKEEQADLERRLAGKREELKAQGLEVQAGAVQRIADRLNKVKESLEQLRRKEKAHKEALEARGDLLQQLAANRERLYATRDVNLSRIAGAANAYAEDLVVHVYFDKGGMREPWVAWLTLNFGFRSPRVQRLAARISPAEFAQALYSDPAKLEALHDDGGEPFFPDRAPVDGVRSWDVIFELQTMRLEDRPRIQVREPGTSEPKELHALSTGQQRSVLLGLLLCAERDEPLVLDQPEDDLDAEYIASGVVRHLEAAKERRQILIATHSPNLTVLGDAELVIPMRVAAGHGQPHAVGAVDRPVTRDCVCALLEGGVEAYRKRGERYGFQFSHSPS
jgi:predicted metal-dependent phosphoesterase TrpH/predicted ATPase